MGLWGFVYADLIMKSDPGYMKSEQANREERLIKDSEYINLDKGEKAIQYKQSLAGCVIYKIVYILLALISIASIVFGGYICPEAIGTTIGMLMTMISAFATLFFVWWLIYQLRIGMGMTLAMLHLGVRNFRIASLVYAIILSIAAILDILIPVIHGLTYSTDMILFCTAKIAGALAIWIIVIIERRRVLI